MPTLPAVPSASGAPPAGRSSLERLRALLLAEGGLIASLVAPAAGAGDGDRAGRGGAGVGGVGGAVRDTSPDGDRATGAAAVVAPCPGPAQLAASGPRADSRREEYELLVEAIYEGYLLHYGSPRVVCTQESDLGVLAGDRLYALGLARLVALGDTEAVAELADTITLGALAQGAGAPELAEAVWMAGARAVGWGSSDDHRRAKELAFAGAREAIEAMHTSAAGPPAP